VNALPLPDLDAAIRDRDGRDLLERLCELQGWRQRSIDEIVDHLVGWFRFWTVGASRTSAIVEELAREVATFPPGFKQPKAKRALRAWKKREYQRALASAEGNLAALRAIDPTADARTAARKDVAAMFSCLVADALVDAWREAADPQRVTIEEAGRRRRPLHIPAALPLRDLFQWLRTRVLDLVARRVVEQMAEVRMLESEALADLYGRSLAYGDPSDGEPPAEIRLAAWINRAQLTPTERDVLAAMLDTSDRKLALHLLTLRRGWESSTVRRHALNLRRKLALTR